MKPPAPASPLIALLLAASQAAAPHPAPAQGPLPNTERIEAGEIESPSRVLLHYRIRLLPLASFPDLPAPVLSQLSRRQCMIPQSFEAKQPENVIHGAFHAPDSDDWAALCSSSGSTTLYVFFSGQFDSPQALRSQPDTAWLGAEPGSSIYGSAWGIATLSAAQLRSAPALRRVLALDHDAIDDARLEHSDFIHYYRSGAGVEPGKWTTLIPDNANLN